MSPGAGSMETDSIRLLSQSCRKVLERLFLEEEAQDDVQINRDGHWASRQFSEFNVWCAKVGINGQGLRSVDVRLKELPEICKMIQGLLQSLDQDLKKMQEPAGMAFNDIIDHDGPVNWDSDSLSLSFDSLSSISQTEDETSIDEGNIADKQKLVLRGHIEETIDRLHGHALQIDRAGDKHRKERLKVYMRKPKHQSAYNCYLELASRKAQIQFHNAAETFHKRMAESFARRRIRFDYLKKHQTKLAIEAANFQQTSAIQAMSIAEPGEPPFSQPSLTNDLEAPLIVDVSARRVEDPRTVYSATEHTKLEIGPQLRRQERAESVASVALRHVEFPPRPRVIGGSFQCPYCRLVFRAGEAQPSRWSQHVMQDFEPYFCIFEDCQAPFDVPNTFDGLLMHLQEHMEERFHVDLPSGGHEIFDEQGLEAYLIRHGACSLENMNLMKEASRRKSALIIESCPFCGGYPDDIEKKYPVSNSHDAQMELRKHIKRHMHDIALFLPPHRDDVTERNDVSVAASDLSHKEGTMDDLVDPEDLATLCGRSECDCKTRGEYEGLNEPPSPPPPEDSESIPEATDFWYRYFPEMPRYDTTPLAEEDYLKDMQLSNFIAGKIQTDAEMVAQDHETAETSAVSDYPGDQTTPEEEEPLVEDVNGLRDNLALCAPETGQWLLESEEFGDWISGRRMNLIGVGIPGAGKTVLASVVIQHLLDRFNNDTTVGVAFAYCDNHHQGFTDAPRLLDTIIRQLIQKLHPPPSGVELLAPTSASFPQYLAYQRLIEAIPLVFGQYTRVFVVIDAIDGNLDDESCRDLYFREFAAEVNLQLFLTTKHVPKHFAGPLFAAQIELRATVSDLSAYVRHRFQMSSSLVKIIAEVQEDVEKWVIHISDGMFLAAKLCVDYIEEVFISKSNSSDEGPRLVRNIISKGRQAQVPKLDEIYAEAMRQISSSDKEMTAKNLLSWATFAKRPLSKQELTNALEQTPDGFLWTDYDIPIELSICSNFVRVDSDDLIVPVHHTSQQYLTRSQQEWRTVSEDLMAAACAIALTIGQTQESNGLLSQERHAFYTYAAVNWGHHAHSAQGRIKEVTNFLENQDAVQSAAQELSVVLLKLPTGMTRLHLIAYFGVIQEARYLLETSSVDVLDDGKRTPLIYAVQNAHESFASLLLNHGANPNMKNEMGKAPLHTAAFKNEIGLVRLLLKAGADINILSFNGWTPLLIAIRHGSEQVAQALIEFGANVDLRDQYGRTPLMMAAYYGNENIVRKLLAKDESFEGHEVRVRESTPVLFAALGHHATILQLLLESGRDIEERNTDGDTVLLSAIKHKDEVAIQLLIDNRANLEARNHIGNTALLDAVSIGAHAIIQTLLLAGADTKVTDRHGKTAMELAAETDLSFTFWSFFKPGDDKEKTLLLAAKYNIHFCVRRLLDLGASVQTRDKEGKTPLLLYIEGVHRSDQPRRPEPVVVRDFLKFGSDIEAMGDDGLTPLLMACKIDGAEKAIRVLLEHGANVHAKDEHGNTPLLLVIAKYAEGKALVELLISYGADIECTNKAGHTPLRLAAEEGDEDIIRILLEHRVNITSKDSEGRTALELATEKGHAVICGLLSDKSHSAEEVPREVSQEDPHPQTSERSEYT